jgi:hypothetical protein
MRYVVLAALFLSIASCGSEQQQAQQKQVSCTTQSGLPDASCTPGAIFPNVATAQVCARGYAQSVRNVPQSEKDQVYAEYGVTSQPTGAYEVDHLISLELGGSNDIANLWPEPYTGPYNAHMKDKVENYLHNQVCSGNITLREAQIEIVKNWETIAT